jgi:hypothetical protein
MRVDLILVRVGLDPEVREPILGPYMSLIGQYLQRLIVDLWIIFLPFRLATGSFIFIHVTIF